MIRHKKEYVSGDSQRKQVNEVKVIATILKPPRAVCASVASQRTKRITKGVIKRLKGKKMEKGGYVHVQPSSTATMELMAPLRFKERKSLID